MDLVENTADVNDGGSTNQRYLNSVKQELFKDFTEAVESSSMDRHLNDVFDELQSRTTSTHEILNKLGISRGTEGAEREQGPTKTQHLTMFEQQDAAEYYEKILTQTSHEASQIFHGELTHTTICHNPRCGANKSTSSHFWHLPLALMDSYSEEYRVVNGIEDYFRDSHFSGLDQMYCEDCDGKVDATVKCEVKHHPEVLVLLLKRFDFDYRYMSYVKNNRSVIIPFTLHIPETQAYELYAVVDHVGDLRGGHYAATIRSEDDDRWYNFNDSSVSLLGYQPFQLDHTERSPNAYLLFYRKQTNVTQNGSRFLSVKYHGLFNQGATSYLNSLLQVLFMTREFREAVNRYILNLRGLCDDLHRHTVDTCSIITTLGINRVYEPQEAAEYVQRVLAPSFHQASQIHGRSTQTRCSKCQTGRSTESTVWHLPLTLMDSNSEEYCVVDGLKQCLTDQVSCERCGCKIDVITKYEVNHHPEVLVLLLKRFDFDSSNMTYVRNNRSVKLPRTLQISESQTYELFAVVEHVGDIRDGHHAAIIKSQDDDRWCNFVNNTYVKPFQDKDTETSHTAHLLFYRRQKPADPCSEDTREVVTCEGSLPATSDTYHQSPDAVSVTHREEEEESVEKGDDTAETVSGQTEHSGLGPARF